MSENLTIEEWIHKNIDRSWEACNNCDWQVECNMDDSFKCPFQDYKIIPSENAEDKLRKIEEEVKALCDACGRGFTDAYRSSPAFLGRCRDCELSKIKVILRGEPS